MEKLKTSLFLLSFLSLHFLSLAYNVPDKYFLNCGSKNNIILPSRTFTGDENSGGFSLTAKHSTSVKTTNKSSDPLSLYYAARTFRQPSAYEFQTDNHGTYMVRLHFFPFSSSTHDLSSAIFDVSVPGFSLLQNFTADNSTNLPLIKEFLLTIEPGNFKIYFVPGDSSFAFVNAIEVFLAPPNFIPADAEIAKPGKNDTYNEVLSLVLHTIYRINVGGPIIISDNDNLWRNWDLDDKYLSNNPSSANSKSSDISPNYQGENGIFFAPASVYQTAKMIEINSSSSFNLTWSFRVQKNAAHFIRVHFCDIISLSSAALYFNLYINDNFKLKIGSLDLNVPFHFDLIVDSGDSGLVNVSISPFEDLRETVMKSAYLNGLEIMESVGLTSFVPEIGKSSNHVSLLVGSVVGGSAFICILIVLIWFGLKFKKQKPVETSEWSPMHLYVGSSHSRVTEGTRIGSPIPNLYLGLKIQFSEIQSATNNFNQKFLIGKGGFGNVYRGTLRNGTKVAVKRSRPGSGQGVPEFQTEVLVLSKIRHRHLVSLIGYCDEKSEMILVYELMEEGTLRDHLYSSKNLPSLSWKQRLEICIGAARGLHYLHKGSARGIIHRDVKSTNILLDEHHVAKVADFGLSRTGPLEETTHVSTNVKGTFGYLDPEYFRTQQLTEKSDVYSFGVVLLEVLCARPAIDPLLPREQMNLAEWGMNCKKEGLIKTIVDPTIMDQIDSSSLRKFSETLEKCLQEDGADRPTMGDVLWDLEYALQLQRTAVQREPHESCTTDVSGAIQLPNLQPLPSFDSIIERDSTAINRYYESMGTSEVFSQLRADDSR